MSPTCTCDESSGPLLSREERTGRSLRDSRTYETTMVEKCFGTTAGLHACSSEENIPGHRDADEAGEKPLCTGDHGGEAAVELKTTGSRG